MLSLASLPTAALAAELKRRQSELPKLVKQAAALREQLAAIEARISSMNAEFGIRATGSSSAGTAKPRGSTASMARHSSPKGTPTIGEHVVAILSSSGSVLSPRDIARSLAPKLAREVTTNFLVQISLTLARLVKQGRVKKVGRGQYAAGSGAAVASND